MKNEYIEELRSTIALLNSMIWDQEDHTKESEIAVKEALEILNLEEGWNELEGCGLDEKLIEW